MRRYLLVSLLIGFAVSAVVVSLAKFGAFGHFGAALAGLYTSAGFLPATTDAASVGHPLEIALTVFAAFAAAWCVIDIPQSGHKVLVFLVLMLVIIGLSPTLALYGVLFEPFPAMSAAILATTAALVYSGTEHGMRKRVLIQVLGSRVSPGTFDGLMNDPAPIRFTGANRVVTVLTCRVFNHAELRERMEPGELVAMGNLFLRNTADFLMSRGAYLDESGPDMVRVFFGMLRPEENHADQACRVALELRTRLRNLNDECENRWFQRLDYGVAISSGPMTVGIYGSPRHFYFSGIGGDSDFARRLAQANSRYGSDILISSRCHQLVKDAVEVRPMEMIYDPGRNLMSEVYQLLALSADFSDEDKARRDAFWQGVILYRSGRFDEALARFNEATPPGGGDGPLKFFTDRCQARLTGDSRPEGTHEITDNGHARLLNMM